MIHQKHTSYTLQHLLNAYAIHTYFFEHTETISRCLVYTTDWNIALTIALLCKKLGILMHTRRDIDYVSYIIPIDITYVDQVQGSFDLIYTDEVNILNTVTFKDALMPPELGLLLSSKTSHPTHDVVCKQLIEDSFIYHVRFISKDIKTTICPPPPKEKDAVIACFVISCVVHASIRCFDTKTRIQQMIHTLQSIKNTVSNVDLYICEGSHYEWSGIENIVPGVHVIHTKRTMHTTKFRHGTPQYTSEMLHDVLMQNAGKVRRTPNHILTMTSGFILNTSFHIEDHLHQRIRYKTTFSDEDDDTMFVSFPWSEIPTVLYILRSGKMFHTYESLLPHKLKPLSYLGIHGFEATSGKFVEM
jgi:hypothetical protein